VLPEEDGQGALVGDLAGSLQRHAVGGGDHVRMRYQRAPADVYDVCNLDKSVFLRSTIQ
jgi:hypothetical protein